MPTAAALRAFYSPHGVWGEAREREERQEKAPPSAYLLRLFGAVNDWIDVTRPPQSGGRVLDVGSGGGELLDFFKSYGWDTFGVDPGDKRAFSRHRELPAVPGTGSFDIAILHHVLEHMPRPLETLQSLHRALKAGGVLFVSVPRLDTLPVHRDLHYCINPRTHIVAFSRDALVSLLATAGFESVDVDSADQVNVADWYALRRLRVMARKTIAPRRGPVRPLNAARAALTRYYASDADVGWVRWLPVRQRAALADWTRGR